MTDHALSNMFVACVTVFEHYMHNLRTELKVTAAGNYRRYVVSEMCCNYILSSIYVFK